MLFLKNDFRVISLLLLSVFCVPWAALGYYEYEIYIKELSVIFIFLLLFCKNVLNQKNLSINQSGRIYFLFLLVCILYYFVEAARLASFDNLSFLTHVLITTILNFVIYFIFVNIKSNKSDLKFFIKVFFIFYLSICVYFIIYASVIHSLSQDLAGGFFTYEGQRELEGNYISYFGGMNGRSWFSLILTSFFVGYFISKKNNFYAFLCICLSLVASYLMMSRGAMIFGAILFVSFIIRYTNAKKLFFSIPFLALIAVIFYINNINSSDVLTLELIQQKSGLSKRDFLVYEAIDLSFNDYFLGRGFHSTSLDRGDFLILGYHQLPYIGTQNVFLSILIELGILGVVLFSLFWLTLFLAVGKFTKFLTNSYEKHYLLGIRYMIVWIMFSYIFNHYSQKSFVAYPIYMILLGIAVSLMLYKKKKAVLSRR